MAEIANRSGKPLTFVQVGSCDGKSNDPLHEVVRLDPHWVKQLTSFDRDVVMSHSGDLAELESRIFTVDVVTRTMGSLIAEADLVEVDLLHIDAEGFDDKIIRDLPLTASWAPQFLLFEKKHLSRTRQVDIRRILKRSGYKVVNLWPDELAYRGPPGG